MTKGSALSKSYRSYQRVKENLLSIPDIAKHTDIKVSAKQIKVSWKKGRQIDKTNRYDHAEPLTEFFR